MKLSFDDNSFIEIKLSKSPGKVEIVLGASDFDNPLKKIVNSAEIDIKDFLKLVYGLGIPISPGVDKAPTKSKSED